MLLFLLTLSLSLTYLIRHIAIKRNVIDIPNERSSHTIPTPRGGGLAIVISWFLGLSFLFVKNEINDNLFYALLSGCILAVVGIIDDIYSLPPKIRLISQLVTAILAVYFLNGFDLHVFQINNIILSTIINSIIIIGIVWFINLYNFLDGIDAYASLEGVFIALALFFFTSGLYLLVLVASILGFLIWNWPKAKIFMGDVGSTQLGFALVVIGIHLHNNLELNFLYWIMLTSVFWFDATYTLFRRWRNKEKLSQAHKKHAYQRLVQAGYSHLKTDVYSIVLNLIILGITLLAFRYSEYVYAFLGLIILLLFLTVHRIDKLFPFKK